MDWLERLERAPDPVLVFVVLMGMVAVFTGFSALRRLRRIEDVPTARVRSAAQGYVELIGTAHSLAGEPIVAPLSQTPCCWFSYRVERRRGNGWQTVQSATSDGIFLLRDATGECLIDPEGAEITTKHRRSWSGSDSGWGGHPVHMRLPSLGRASDTLVKVTGKVFDTLGSGIAADRYHEEIILDGDPLYVLGIFHTQGLSDHETGLRELTAAILRDWKRNPAALRERFDVNADGSIDQDEWQLARVAAQAEATAELAGQLGRGPLSIMRRPSDRRHYLISNLEEFGLVRRYRWRMLLGFLAFVLLAAVAAVMLSARI